MVNELLSARVNEALSFQSGVARAFCPSEADTCGVRRTLRQSPYGLDDKAAPAQMARWSTISTRGDEG